MSYLKLLFNFFKYLIIENPIKMVMIFITSICFNYAGTFSGKNDYHDLVTQSKDGNTYIYVVKSKSRNDYEVFSSDKKEVIKNGQLQVWNYNDFNTLLYIIGGIISLIIIILTLISLISDDDDFGWDFKECYQRSISTLIYCELEEGIYYYMIMGRLIEMRKDQIRYTSNVAREMRIFNMSDVFRLPKFSTKTQKRNNNLDKLGIN